MPSGSVQWRPAPRSAICIHIRHMNGNEMIDGIQVALCCGLIQGVCGVAIIRIRIQNQRRGAFHKRDAFPRRRIVKLCRSQPPQLSALGAVAISRRVPPRPFRYSGPDNRTGSPPHSKPTARRIPQPRRKPKESPSNTLPESAPRNFPRWRRRNPPARPPRPPRHSAPDNRTGSPRIQNRRRGATRNGLAFAKIRFRIAGVVRADAWVRQRVRARKSGFATSG